MPLLLSRRELYVAVFLHDIAKGRGGDHSVQGEVIAKRLCPRLGLPDDATETVAWLVRNHLVMSRFAFKRDSEDPQTIQDFVAHRAVARAAEAAPAADRDRYPGGRARTSGTAGRASCCASSTRRPRRRWRPATRGPPGEADRERQGQARPGATRPAGRALGGRGRGGLYGPSRSALLAGAADRGAPAPRSDCRAAPTRCERR